MWQVQGSLYAVIHGDISILHWNHVSPERSHYLMLLLDIWKSFTKITCYLETFMSHTLSNYYDTIQWPWWWNSFLPCVQLPSVGTTIREVTSKPLSFLWWTHTHIRLGKCIWIGGGNKCYDQFYWQTSQIFPLDFKKNRKLVHTCGYVSQTFCYVTTKCNHHRI